MVSYSRVHLPALQTGFAYVAVLFLLATISISLAVVTQDEATTLMREKERDWLFIGQQYQQAIKSYYEKSPDGIKILPMQIEDLTLDSRYIAPVRHLRNRYIDPLTENDWQLIRNEEGFLIGVYSASQIPILLRQNVAQLMTSEGSVNLHSEVKFIFVAESSEADENSENQDEDSIESDEDSIESDEAE